jgi:hypothetical protein
MSTQAQPSRTPETGDVPELRFTLNLQNATKHVASRDRLLHVALRHLAPYFAAPNAIVFVRERSDRLGIAYQMGDKRWDP